MGHPFFDASTSFPRYLDEGRALEQALSQTIENSQRIKRFYEDCGQNLPPLALGGPPDVIWQQVLDNLARAKLLKKLFDLLMTESLPLVHDRIRRATAAVDVVERTVLPDGAPMVLDRGPLRALLDGLAKSASPSKILVVRGARGSGRSWTLHLVNALARSRKEEPVIYYCSDTVGDVHGLIGDLFDRLGAPGLLPPALTGDPAYYLKVCSKLALAADTAKKIFWIVVDDLDEDDDGVPLMDREILNFLKQFGLALKNPAVAQWFRLVLIAYPADSKVPLPARWKSEHYGVEDTTIDSVQESHLAVGLDELAARDGRALLAKDRDEIAKRVIEKGNAASPRQRLKTIYDAFSEEIAKLGGNS